MISAEHPKAKVIGWRDPEAWATRRERSEPDPPEVKLALDRGWAMEIEGDLESPDGGLETVGTWLGPSEVEEFWKKEAPDFLSIRVVVMGELDSVPG